MTRTLRVLVAAAAVGAVAVGVSLKDRGPSLHAAEIQTQSLQAALAADVAQMAEKFVGLARVMEGKYDWRPGDGIRSVGEVFNLIAGENRMLTGLLTNAPGGGRMGGMGGRGQAIPEPAAMQEALQSTYAALEQAIAGLSDTDLNASVQMFGREMTKRSAIMMLISDQHEHLGQSIAYARTNGVAPPWSRPMN